ncbi:Sugar transporter [Musa troglodytarum]|uniref:Sugar transporter n=1 Tax=Musa troglodytarum TaxID=320322 RepID=A0A9E7I412_9LILI|nr:Sugar transporter [Musa troglodytarum]
MASVLAPSATVRTIAGGFASPLPSRLTPTKVHYNPQPLRSMKKSKKNAAASLSSRLPLLPTVITPNLRLRPQAQGADYSSPSSSDDATEDAFSWSSVVLPFLFPALGGLLFGYDIGATSGASISLQSAELSGTTWFNLSAVQLGLVVSGSLYGALAGSLIAYPTSDFLGRRRELIAAAALYLVGGLVMGCAPDLVVLIIGRLIYGIGIGMAMHGAPLYIAETSPSQIRGTLISLKELFIVLGILLGYLVGSVEITAVGGWRYMYGLSAPIAVVMALGMWTQPPSPRWLLLRAVQGKGALEDYKEKAMNALAKLRGRPAGDKISEKQIDETLVSLKAAYAEEESEGSLLEVFQGASLKAFIIGGGLVLFQQITGQPSVLYYATSILQSAGFSAASDAARVSVVIGVFKLLMTGIAVLKVDNLGRRPLLIGGVGGIVLSLFLLAAYYKVLGSLPLVAVGALLLYVGSYQELLGPENIFLLFGAIALLSLAFVFFYVPETKGLSLEEIETKILN